MQECELSSNAISMEPSEKESAMEINANKLVTMETGLNLNDFVLSAVDELSGDATSAISVATSTVEQYIPGFVASKVSSSHMTNSLIVIGSQNMRAGMQDGRHILIIPKSKYRQQLSAMKGIAQLKKLSPRKGVQKHLQKFIQLQNIVYQMKIDVRPACTGKHMAIERLKRKIHIALTLLAECRKLCQRHEESSSAVN